MSTYLKLLGVALLWGSTFIAGRVAAPVLPHFTLASLRFAVGLACLLVALLLMERRWPRLSARQHVVLAAMGLTGVFAYNLFFFGALERIPAGRAALVVALNPIVTAVAMSLVFHERLGPRRWAGIGLALAGVWIVLSKGEAALILQRIGRGEALMLGGALTWASYTVLQKLLAGRPNEVTPSALAVVTVSTAWGALFLVLGVPLEWAQWTAAQLTREVLLAILLLGAGGTAVAFVWYAQGVARLGPARASVFNNLVPVFGALLATLLLREPLLTSMVVGGLVALAGVTLTNVSLAPRRRDE
jgi:drug/metabolite transporter (DMT)-like permease